MGICTKIGPIEVCVPVAGHLNIGGPSCTAHVDADAGTGTKQSTFDTALSNYSFSSKEGPNGGDRARLQAQLQQTGARDGQNLWPNNKQAICEAATQKLDGDLTTARARGTNFDEMNCDINIRHGYKLKAGPSNDPNPIVDGVNVDIKCHK